MRHKNQEENMNLKAREFAINAHGDQMYGTHPYSFHLDAVATIAKKYGETAETIAYLHDVVEDTKVTLAEIEREFGALVANCVAILTDEPGQNRKERKAKTYAKMAKVSGEENIALLVKAADRLANMRASVSDKNHKLIETYKSEYPVFKPAVYRKDLCEEIWQELDALNYEE
jgi:guanosine-3',5'-bis(diphosphate) 3'-pyrophosphohydrolase